MEHDIIAADSLSDTEIIQRIKKGDSSLFALLMNKYNPALYKIARGYGFNHQDAEDLLQDSRVSAYYKLSQFKFRSAFKTWMSKIMIHKCLYKLKYGHRRYIECSCLINETIDCRPIGEQFENAETIFLKKELRTVLQKTLQELPAIYQMVFIFREVEGYSGAETAALLKISVINVRVRLNRAKIMLQKKFKHLYFTDGFNV